MKTNRSVLIPIFVLIMTSTMVFPFTCISYANPINPFITQVLSPMPGINGYYQSYLPMVSRELGGFFVSPNGSDANPGTQSQPWRTIGKAARMLVSGDTLYIRGGVYQEAVEFARSGTSYAPIRILAYPGEVPVIDGNNFILPNHEFGPLLTLSGDYIQVSGLEVRYSRGMGVNISGSHDTADNLYSHHNKENGILISRGQYSIVENSRVWLNALTNEYGQANSWSSGLSAARYGVSYATIRHNTVWENWGEGISSFEADHIVIEDNFTHDNFTAGIYLSDSTNVLCQRNFVYTDPTSYMNPWGNYIGIMLGDETYDPPSANITVINNISFGNHGNFWWWQGVQGGGMNNVLIANNTFVNGIGEPNHGQGGVIISDGEHQNVRFENNLIQQDGDLPTISTIYQLGITYSHNLWSKTPDPEASGVGDVIGDPRLAQVGDMYAPEWFKLTDVSPAIDKAIPLPEVTVDYFNKTRSVPSDMGAIEYFIPP
jgi:hypothetical protein